MDNAQKKIVTDLPNAETSPLPPLRTNWRFQLLWIGSTSATVGVEVADIGYPLIILALTNSPATAGVFGFLQASSSLLFSVPASHVIDRLDRRRLLMAAELGRALAAASVAWAVAADHITVPHLMSVAVLIGLGSAFGGPVRMLLIRSVVDPRQLTRALAQDEIREGAAGLAGPPFGGLLYALGRALPFFVCALSFLVSLVCAWVVRPAVASRGAAAPDEDEDEPAATDGGVLAGVRALVADPLLRGALLIITVFYCAATAVSLIVVVRLQQAGTSPRMIGLALAGLAIGSLIGAPLIERVHRWLRPGRLLLAVSAIMAALLAVLATTADPWWILVILIGMTVALPATRVLLDVLIFRQVPDEHRGRTIVATMTTLSVGPPLGTLAAGLLLQFAGPGAAIAAFAGLQAVATCYALADRRIAQREWPAPG